MDISRYKDACGPLTAATLVYLLRDDQILLGYKKTGFGKGKYVGIGGKIEPGETSEQGIIRECQEEIGVTILDPVLIGDLSFYFPEVENPSKWNMHVDEYVCTKWKGEIIETDEIRPEWFSIDAIPYSKMREDVWYCLPHMLERRQFTGSFVFNADLRVSEYHVRIG